MMMTSAPQILRFFQVAAAIALASCQPATPPVETTPSAEPTIQFKKPVISPDPGRLPPSERGESSSISIEKAFELQQSGDVLIYDARPSVFYNAGHIAGAVNFPKSIASDVFKAREPELKAAKAAGKPIIVYCTGYLCADARTVSRLLASRGYSSSVLSGGWDQWKAAGLPTE